MPRPLRKRIYQSLVATTFARVVQFSYAIVLVRVLLVAWGKEAYGEWIVLMAVAGIGSVITFGIVQASASETMLAVGADDRERSSSLYVTTLATTFMFAILTMLVVYGLILVSDIRVHLGISIMSRRDADSILMLAFASSILSLFIPPFSSALSVSVGNALTTVVSSSLKLAELVSIAAITLAGGSFVWVTAALVVSAGLNIVIHSVLVRRFVPWLTFNPAYFDGIVLRNLLRPSIGQFLMYVSVNTVAIQLPRVIVGYLLGPAAVANFSVTVTYMRAGRTITSLFSQALQAETTRAYAEKQQDRLFRLVSGLCQLHLWCSITIMTVLTIFGEKIFAVWTHGGVQFDWVLCSLIGIGFVAGSYADAIILFLLGINRILSVAIAHLVAAALAIIFAIFMIPRWGLASIAAVMLLPEFAAASLGVSSLASTVGLSVRKILVATTKIPTGLIRAEIARFTRTS